MDRSELLIKDDLHVHLYGCVGAEDLFNFGKDRWRTQEARLEWYASEYETHVGRRPDYRSYWTAPSGFDQMRQDFEFLDPAPFSVFQAKFNLVIALLPVDPRDPGLLPLALKQSRLAGTRHIEYRTFLPPTLTASDLDAYLQTLTATLAEDEQTKYGALVPRLALTLSRDPAHLTNQYRLLRHWLTAHPAQARFITGIDFCGVEEGFPPHDKAEFFARVHRDNAADPNSALALLYHVGESFDRTSLMSSARWVFQAAELGVHRLGHGISLGVDPKMLLGKSVEEPRTERVAHLKWLLEHAGWLKDYGYTVETRRCRRELEALGSLSAPTVCLTYVQELVSEIAGFQAALMARMAETSKAVIEACPTSNLRIARIPSPAVHPLGRFIAAGLNVCVASDDPGILATSLAAEETLLRNEFGLSHNAIKTLAAAAAASSSAQLVCRAETVAGSR